MLNKSDFDFISQLKDDYPQLSHASNILVKYKSNLKDLEKNALDLLVPEYAKYLKNMLDIKTYHDDDIRKKVQHLNTYYNFMHEHGLDRAFSSQGKFRPTILEEFLFLLFKDYVNHIKHQTNSHDVLDSGAVKAYSNIFFKARDFENFIQSPEIGINEKDQDYAIYRTFDISINHEPTRQIRIPAVAIEAKTYIDKTMLDTIIATAEKIKSGNPHTRFIAVTERYDVSYSVDPAYSRIDQIYVLRRAIRKKEWMDIDETVVLRMFHETIGHLERPWSDVEARIKNEGIVI